MVKQSCLWVRGNMSVYRLETCQPWLKPLMAKCHNFLNTVNGSGGQYVAPFVFSQNTDRKVKDEFIMSTEKC